MSEWKEVPIGECIDLISGYAFKSANFLSEQSENSLPVIKIKNVANGDVNIDNVVYHEISNDLEKFRISKGDVLIAMTGNHPQAQTQVVGDVSKYKLSSNSLLNQRVGKFVVKNDTNLDFIYYLFKSEDVKGYLANQSSGSANQANISKGDILGLKLGIPEPKEQTAIASLLSSLDDKIDLLKRQNQTLEKMAETLFRQWFVEEAKEEWEEGTLDNILTIKGGTTPSTSEPKYWNGTIHWTSPKDITTLSGIYLFDTERKITELGLSKIGSGLMPKGTLLMSSRAPVGVLAFCEVPVAINQGYIAIIDDKGYSKEFIYLWLKTNLEVVHNHSNGSTFMEISKSTFKTLALQIPPKQTVTDFQLLIEPLFEKIKINEIQVGSLTSLRDTLLPKLMSGEVRVDF